MSDTAMRPSHAWEPWTQQQVFRQLLDAFSYPGRIAFLPDRKTSSALSLVLAALVDHAVSLADPQDLLDTDHWRRLGAQRQAAEQAHFVVARGDLAPAFVPAIGTLESPEQGATILLQVAHLGKGVPLQLSGPGIDGSAHLLVTGLHGEWLQQHAAWNTAFPLGVDLVLFDTTGVAALPRTTRIDFSALNDGGTQ